MRLSRLSDSLVAWLNFSNEKEHILKWKDQHCKKTFQWEVCSCLSLMISSNWGVSFVVPSISKASKCPSDRTALCLDLTYFIFEKVCSHMYVVPNMETNLSASFLNDGY